MSDVTKILNQLEQGDRSAAEQLLPLVYDELRRLAKQRMQRENPGHTLQATALVHEAYVRLVDSASSQEWDSRGHFFSAAAEAMRRILIENARRRNSQKRGGQHEIQPLQDGDALATADLDELMELNEALDKLNADDADAAEVANLRLFAGLSVAEVGDALGISRTTAFRRWSYAQAWLTAEMSSDN